MLAIMWYSILELLYSPFVMQLLRNSSGVTTSPEVALSSPTTVAPTPGRDTRPCPEFNETTGIRLLYYADPPNGAEIINRCKELRSVEPCGQNMRFYATDGTLKTGYCDCDDASNRLLIHHQETNKCYPIFSQGYCSEGMWLDFTPEGMPICTENPCFNKNNEPAKDLVVFNGTCVEVLSKCGDANANMVIDFQINKRPAQCISKFAQFMLIRAIGTPQVKCSPGTFRASNGKCQPAFDLFD